MAVPQFKEAGLESLRDANFPVINPGFELLLDRPLCGAGIPQVSANKVANPNGGV